jgi:hypothetical protein
MAPLDRTTAGNAAVTALVALLVLALGAAVVYLLSDINSRRYRIAVENGSVVVENGRRLPWGFHRYEPATPELTAAYAPFPLPPGESLAKTEVFEDRADVDRALFSLFAGWARGRLSSSTPGDFELVVTYVHRSEQLPSLSEEQRLELKRLRADLAYRNGRRMLDDISDRLHKSLAELKLARELGPTKPSDVDRWIVEVERRLRDSSAMPQAESPSPPLTPEAPPPISPAPAVLAPVVPTPAHAGSGLGTDAATGRP